MNELSPLDWKAAVAAAMERPGESLSAASETTSGATMPPGFSAFRGCGGLCPGGPPDPLLSDRFCLSTAEKPRKTRPERCGIFIRTWSFLSTRPEEAGPPERFSPSIRNPSPTKKSPLTVFRYPSLFATWRKASGRAFSFSGLSPSPRPSTPRFRIRSAGPWTRWRRF